MKLTESQLNSGTSESTSPHADTMGLTDEAAIHFDEV